MIPTFWKLSQGTEQFGIEDMLQSVAHRLVYVYKDTRSKATSEKTQAQNFVDAAVGDYFYLTHGNWGIYVLGQFSGPTNVFSSMGEGWLDRPFRLIKAAISQERYEGEHKWWTPNDNSTFIRVPPAEHELFEQMILRPYFGIRLGDFGIGTA